MEKLKTFLYKGVLVVLTIFMIYVTFCSIYNIYSPIYELKPIILIIGTIVLLYFFYTLKKITNKISKRNCNICVAIISIIFFILFIIVGNSVKSYPKADLSNITKEVKVMLKNGGRVEDTWYFSMYSNQIPLLTFIYYISKIAKFFLIENIDVFLIAVHSLLITITAIFIYLIGNKTKDHKSGFLAFIFFVLNPIIYIYASYYYTDTICMPFIMLGLYLYICGIKSRKKTNIILNLLVGGISFAVAIRIRVVSAIIVIGLIIGLFISNKEYRKMLVKILYLIIGIVIGLLICKGIENTIDLKIDENYRFPIYHWIMLGCNQKSDGKWTGEDWSYTNSKKTYIEKKNANIDEIKQRIKKIGLYNMFPYMKTKLRVVWTNGAYNYMVNIANVENKNILYEYIIGNKNIFIQYFLQIMKITLLMSFLIQIIINLMKKEKDFFNSGINIAIFGTFLFYLFWEVMTKYSFTFLPWMILLFPVGIDGFAKILSIKNVIIDYKYKININKVVYSVPKIIMVLTILLFITNFNKYAVEKNGYKDVRVNQEAERDQKINKIADKTIKQEFETGKSFNQVVLNFLKGNTTSNTNYAFELYRADEEKLLYKEEFSSKDIENKKEKKFSFKRIKPDGMQKYYIKIY